MKEYRQEFIDRAESGGFSFHVFDSDGEYSSSWCSYDVAQRIAISVNGKVYNYLGKSV